MNTGLFFWYFREKSQPNKISRSVVVTWLTNTNMTSLKPERFGVSVQTPWDPILLLMPLRESNTWMKSRTLLLLDSNGLQKRYVFDCCGFLFYCNFIFLPQDSSNCRRIVIHISHLSYSKKKTLWQQNDNFHKSSSLRTGY